MEQNRSGISARVACKFDPDRTGPSLDKDHLKTIISNLGYTNIYHDQSKKTIGFR